VLLLAIDTATPATTVALVRDGVVLAERSHVDARRHGELLAPLVSAALGDAGLRMRDVESVAVGIGPGAYTGLRVGLVSARSMADALGVPVHGVVTLDALAFASELAGPLVVVTDARRREVFVACYADSTTRTSGPEVTSPDVAVERVAGRPVVGAGGTPFADRFGDVRGPDLPAAGALGRLAWRCLAAGDPLPSPDPLYLRKPDVSVPAGSKPVTPR